MPYNFVIYPYKNREVFYYLDINYTIIDAILVSLLKLDILQVYKNGSRAPYTHDVY
jgi:hypothetical protein